MMTNEAPPAITTTYRQALIDLTSLDVGSDVADVAAEFMSKAFLSEQEILQAMYTQALRLFGQACTRASLAKSPADVWGAAATLHESAQDSLAKHCDYLINQHKHLAPVRFADTAIKGYKTVRLLPSLDYQLSSDGHNICSATIRLGSENANDGTTVLSPGESMTVSGRDSVDIMGGDDLVLLSWSRIGGAYISGKLKNTVRLPSAPKAKAAPKKRRFGFW